MKNILFLLTLLISVPLLAQEKYDLVYKLEPGKSYRYRGENSFTATQEMMGSEMTVSGDSRNLSLFVMEEVTAEGHLILVGSLEESTVRTNAMGRDTTLEMKDLLGKRTRYEVDARGSLIASTPIDSVAKGMDGMGDQLFGQTMMIELPDHAVAIGEKWTTSSSDTTKEAENESITVRNTTFELAAREEKNGHSCLRIVFTETHEITGKMKQFGMDMFMEGEGETKGIYWFDPEKGLYVAQESETSQDITMAITGQAQMTIPSSQVIKQKAFLVEP